jgi:glutamate-5-semialdehyde dehydrogenase
MTVTAAIEIPALMTGMGARARAAATVLRTLPAEVRSRAIAQAANSLRAHRVEVLVANIADVEAARRGGAADGLVDRLRLDETRVEAIASALDAIAAQPDPVGRELARWRRPNGLDIARVAVPIGVLAIIYESRPNVTADAAALCLRSGNAAILRCGSDCLQSSLAIHACITEGLRAAGAPEDAIQLVPTPDRAAVGALLSGLDGTVDLIIPRGGKSLVARVQAEARAPVLGHLEGLCHTYLHPSADTEKAAAIVLNAKLRRVAVCGATETLLVDQACAERLLPPIAQALTLAGCELRGDPAARALVPEMTAAEPADWDTEYLAPILAVAVVADMDAAMAHIARHGSGHTDAIVAEDAAAAERYLAGVDSSFVVHNASTQFADGGEFGFGAEIGISTSRLHARGPVGAEQLTTYKYAVRGEGQTRP